MQNPPNEPLKRASVKRASGNDPILMETRPPSIALPHCQSEGLANAIEFAAQKLMTKCVSPVAEIQHMPAG